VGYRVEGQGYRVPAASAGERIAWPAGFGQRFIVFVDVEGSSTGVRRSIGTMSGRARCGRFRRRTGGRGPV
jgi:hypothetical protein